MDKIFMNRAIELARAGMLRKCGGPFGAVVVRDGVIVGEGSNCVTSRNDPTAHAEIQAIRQACESLGTFTLEGATIYTTCEPCPMCYGAIFWSRMREIVYASNRDDAAIAGFDDRKFWDEYVKPISERGVHMREYFADEAASLFDEWSTLPDKIPY